MATAVASKARQPTLLKSIARSTVVQKRPHVDVQNRDLQAALRSGLSRLCSLSVERWCQFPGIACYEGKIKFWRSWLNTASNTQRREVQQLVLAGRAFVSDNKGCVYADDQHVRPALPSAPHTRTRAVVQKRPHIDVQSRDLHAALRSGLSRLCSLSVERWCQFPGIACYKGKIKFWRSWLNTASNTQRREVQQLVLAGRAFVSDNKGCVYADDQFPVQSVIADCIKDPSLATGTANAMLSAARAMTIYNDTDIHARDDFGNIVDHHTDTHTLLWSIHSRGSVCGYTDNRQHPIRLRDDMIIALRADVGVYPITMWPTVGIAPAVKLPITANVFDFRQITDSLNTYGMPKPLAKQYSPAMAAANDMTVTDFSYIFEFASAMTMDLLSARATNCVVHSMVARTGWIDGMDHNLMFSTWRLHDGGQWFPQFDAWVKDNCTTLHIAREEEIAFFTVIDILRSAGLYIDKFFEEVGAYWRRRTSMVRFRTISFWTSFAPVWHTFQTIQDQVNLCRRDLIRTPQSIMLGAHVIAKKYGVEEQLETAWTRMTAICSGPVLPLAPNPNEFVEYIAVTPFFEVGDLSSMPHTAPHIGWCTFEVHCAAASYKSATITDKSTPSIRDLLNLQLSELVTDIAGTRVASVPLIHNFWATSELTFACFSLVANTLGLTWDVVQSIYGLAQVSDYLFAGHMLHARDDGAGHKTPSIAVAATVKIVTMMSNIVWPKECLPYMTSRWSYDLPISVKRRLYGGTSANFGNGRRIIAWINHIAAIPDVFIFSKGAVVGNLSASVHFNITPAGTASFQLWHCMSDEYFRHALSRRNPCRDMNLFREASLFISAVVRGARRVVAKDNLGHTDELYLENDLFVVPDGWQWPSDQRYLLNGETIIPYFKLHMLTLDPQGGRLNVRPVENVPS